MFSENFTGRDPKPMPLVAKTSAAALSLIRHSERRRCSFASAFQSHSMPCAGAQAAIAAVKPACRSSTVPYRYRRQGPLCVSCSPQPARTLAAGTMKLLTINRRRSSSCACSISRSAWIAAPVAVAFQSQSVS